MKGIQLTGSSLWRGVAMGALGPPAVGVALVTSIAENEQRMRSMRKQRE